MPTFTKGFLILALTGLVWLSIPAWSQAMDFTCNDTALCSSMCFCPLPSK